MDEMIRKSLENLPKEIKSKNEEVTKLLEREDLDVDIVEALKNIVSNIDRLLELNDVTNQRIKRLAHNAGHPNG